MWCCGMGKASLRCSGLPVLSSLVCHVGATPWSAASPASHVRWAMHATCTMPLLHFVYSSLHCSCVCELRHTCFRLVAVLRLQQCAYCERPCPLCVSLRAWHTLCDGLDNSDACFLPRSSAHKMLSGPHCFVLRSISLPVFAGLYPVCLHVLPCLFRAKHRQHVEQCTELQLKGLHTSQASRL